MGGKGSVKQGVPTTVDDEAGERSGGRFDDEECLEGEGVSE